MTYGCGGAVITWVCGAGSGSRRAGLYSKTWREFISKDVKYWVINYLNMKIHTVLSIKMKLRTRKWSALVSKRNLLEGTDWYVMRKTFPGVLIAMWRGGGYSPMGTDLCTTNEVPSLGYWLACNDEYLCKGTSWYTGEEYLPGGTDRRAGGGVTGVGVRCLPAWVYGRRWSSFK